jgi:hypothetical protein
MNQLANIGDAQRKLRYWSAAAAALFSLAFAIVLITLHLDHLWRLLIYFPLIVAAGGYLEARTSTCVALGMNQQCSMEKEFNVLRTLIGDKIHDPELAAALRRKAFGVMMQMQALAIGLTLLFFLLPL